MSNIIKIQLTSKKLCPGQEFKQCVHCDFEDITLGQGHDTPWNRSQQLCLILCRSNLTVTSYGPNKDFSYVCTVTLTFGQGHDTPLG